MAQSPDFHEGEPMWLYAATALIMALSASIATPARAQGAGFLFDVINEVSNMTVIGLRPSSGDKAGVLDIYPKGAPAQSGKAWIHVCDADLDAGPSEYRCAQVLITNIAARFGVIRSAGNTRVPVEIVSNADKLGIFRLRDGDSGPAQLIVGQFDSLAVVGQMAEMRRENARLTQRLATVEAERNTLRASVSEMDNRLRAIEARVAR